MRCTEVIEMERVLKLNNLPVPVGIILEPDAFEELHNDAEEWAEDYIVGYTRQNQTTPFSWNGIWFYSRDSRFTKTETLNRLCSDLGNVLRSATPHPTEHPTMHAAWKRAQATLAAIGHPIPDQCLN